MEHSLKPPSELNLDVCGNYLEIWKAWKNDFLIYLQATESASKSDLVKSSILLHCIGKNAKEIYQTFTFDQDSDKMKYDSIIAKFDEYFMPRKNLTFLRFSFLTARQEQGEKFDDFYTRLRKLSEDCELGDLRNSLVKDVIIIGLYDKRLQERLLRESDINLDKVLKNCRACEASKIQTKTIQKKEGQPHVDRLKKKTRNHGPSKEMINNCKFCAGQHPRGSCPAYSRTCSKCNQKGHYSSCCTKSSRDSDKSTKHRKRRSGKKVDKVQNDSSDSESSSDEFFIGSITLDKQNLTDTVVDAIQKSDPPPLVNEYSSDYVDSDDERSYSDDSNSSFPDGSISDDPDDEDWNIVIETNGTDITYKMDSGAQVDVLPLRCYRRLRKPAKLHKTSSKLTAYSGHKIKVVGKCIVYLRRNGKIYPVLFTVADTNSPPILGLKSCLRLNLIKRVDSIDVLPSYLSNFEDCFGELGTLKKEYHIVMDPNVTPVIDACRKVPVALRDRLQKELVRMEKLGIITPVTEPTDWVSSMVMVEKPNGSLRICLDPANLNKAIKRHHHKLPSTDDILAQMPGAKFFCKLDASNAYWQVLLDEESSHLLTFNTPFGRYHFLRMPFGIHSASEICQAYIAEIIERVTGALNCQDDIIVWGTTLPELRERVVACLKAIRDSGLKLNLSKCQFEMTELDFLRHTLSANGIEPDFRKIEAILEMPNPTNVKELQRFLGMINYLGKFIPKL